MPTLCMDMERRCLAVEWAWVARGFEHVRHDSCPAIIPSCLHMHGLGHGGLHHDVEGRCIIVIIVHGGYCASLHVNEVSTQGATAETDCAGVQLRGGRLRGQGQRGAGPPQAGLRLGGEMRGRSDPQLVPGREPGMPVG
jgi:hypothetical protein